MQKICTALLYAGMFLMCQKVMAILDLKDDQGAVQRLIILERLIYVAPGVVMEKAEEIIEKQGERKKHITYSATYLYALHTIKDCDKKENASVIHEIEDKKQEISVKITLTKDGGSFVAILNKNKLPSILQGYLVPIMQEILLCRINTFKPLELEKIIDSNTHTIIYPNEIGR